MNDITLEQARQIAIGEVERLRNSPRLSRYEFSPVQLLWDEDLAWTFVSGSEQLQDEGWVPGALFATVDKRDGHLWSEDEFEQYHTAPAANQSQESAQVSAGVA